jgi:N6-adenosine-specific RNA methylase IME4
MTAWPFRGFAKGSFDLVMADPPWSFETRSAKGKARSADRHYSTMPLPDISRLPVGDLAARNAVLWLWVTAPVLEVSLDVMACWGFRYSTSGVWVKMTAAGQPAYGLGYRLRNGHEPFLIGVKGEPRTEAISSVIQARRREHSRKPDEAFLAAEAMMPEAKRIELFSRERRAGWSAWGNEVGRFS